MKKHSIVTLVAATVLSLSAFAGSAVAQFPVLADASSATAQQQPADQAQQQAAQPSADQSAQGDAPTSDQSAAGSENDADTD